MRKSLLSYLSAVSLAAIAGCAAPVDSSEDGETSSVAQALTAAGVTASLTKVTQSGSIYTATITIHNQSNEPINNWQIGIRFNTGSFANQWSGTGVTWVAGVPIFTAPYYAATINAGASYSFTVNGNATGNNYWPSITSVDGVAPGTPNSGNPADGVDVISRAAATTAVNVAYEYQKYKLPIVNSDPNYFKDSGLLWDSHSYRVASGNTTIEFDPNVPGYEYIPTQAKAELAFAQQDPMVASYLTTGLADCFGQVNSWYVYGFKTGVLAITFPGGGSGYLPTAGDNWTTTTKSVGGTMRIFTTLTSTTDTSFAILTDANIGEYNAVNPAVNAKYNSNGQNASCSPFNGPGGSNNPYLVMSLGNGSSVPARYLPPSSNTNCSAGCKATATLDPVPYAEPGAYYDTNNNLVGPQPNPFSLIGTTLYADPAHQGEWSTRTVNGTQEWGTFSKAVTIYGTTKYQYVKQY